MDSRVQAMPTLHEVHKLFKGKLRTMSETLSVFMVMKCAIFQVVASIEIPVHRQRGPGKELGAVYLRDRE